MARGKRLQRRARGFTYIGLLVLVAVIGIMLAAAGEVASTAAQRDREAQLLWVGHEYRAAIGRYWNKRRSYPPSLQDLLGAAPGTASDTAVPVRYLRRLYPDPMTNAVDWALVAAPSGGIMGVASSSKRAPLKTAHFEDVDQEFEKATSYNDWQFTFAPAAVVLPPAQNGGAANPAVLSQPGTPRPAPGQGTVQPPTSTSAVPWGSRNRSR
jgi:type II secretory pathway pseudopilin PulG